MFLLREYFPVVALVGLVLGSVDLAGAQSQPPGCQAVVGVPGIVRMEGYSELVGDLTLLCTGGTEGERFLTDFQIFLNTNITSRILNGSNLSEALMIIGEPQPEAQILCPLPMASAANPGGCNVFKGTKGPDENSLVWIGFPYTAPASGSQVIRITNIRVSAAGLGFGTLIPSQVVMFISSPGNLTITNPQQTVAFVQQGLLFDVRNCQGAAAPGSGNSFSQCSSQNSGLAGGVLSGVNTSQFSLRFREGFQGAFRPQVEVSGSTVSQFPSTPGWSYHSESGFLLSNNAGSDPTGWANSSTRLATRFHNIPAGVRLFVGARQSTASSASARAVLISTDMNGSTGTGFSSSGIASSTTIRCSVNSTTNMDTPAVEVPIANGKALAVWEVVASSPAVSESLVFPVAVAYASNPVNSLPGLGTANVWGSFAPFYAANATPNVAVQSGSLPLPRFIDNNPITATGFVISACAQTPAITPIANPIPAPEPSRIEVAVPAINFLYEQSGTTASVKSLMVRSSAGAMGFSVTAQSGGPWLSVTPASGLTPAPIAVWANASGLAPGTYRSVLLISSGSATAAEVQVTLTVTGKPQFLAIPNELALSAEAGGGAFSETLYVTAIARHANLQYSFTAKDGGRWLNVAKPDGMGETTPVNLKVTIDPAGLSPGVYEGIIALTSSDPTYTPVTVPVKVMVGTR